MKSKGLKKVIFGTMLVTFMAVTGLGMLQIFSSTSTARPYCVQVSSYDLLVYVNCNQADCPAVQGYEWIGAKEGYPYWCAYKKLLQEED